MQNYTLIASTRIPNVSTIHLNDWVLGGHKSIPCGWPLYKTGFTLVWLNTKIKDCYVHRLHSQQNAIFKYILKPKCTGRNFGLTAQEMCLQSCCNILIHLSSVWYI